MEKLWEWLQKFWSIPLFIIGAITEVSQFIELWRGSRETTTWIAIATGFTLIVVTAGYVSFSRVESPIIRAHSSRKPLPRFPKLYVAARFCLIAILISAVSAGFVLYRQDLALRDKLVVLVTTFDGPDPQQYRVTDIIIGELTNVISKYGDTAVRSISKSISESDGAEVAKKIGKQYRADLVIWGWYGVTESDVMLTVHIESLNTSAASEIPNSSYTLLNPIEEIKSFEFQQKLSDQMTSLTLFTGGILRFEAGDYEGALSRLVLAEDLYIWPEEIGGKEILYSYLGHTYSHLHQHENAFEAYSLTISANPNNAEGYLNRCYTLMSLSKFEEAFKDCNKATEIEPLIEGAYIARAHLHWILGDLEKAWDDINYEMQAFPNAPNSYSARAYLLADQEEPEKALADAKKAAELAPNEPHSYINLAAYYLALGNFSECIKTTNKAFRMASEARAKADAYDARSICYREMGDLEAALNDVNTAIKFNPNDDDLYFGRGVLHAFNNQFADAILDYSKAIELNPVRPDVYINRGSLFLQQEMYQKALDDYKKAVKYGPHLVRAWYGLGAASSELHQYNSAVLAFSKALEQNSVANSDNAGVEYARIYYVRALAFKGWGNTNAAIQDFEASLASPDITEEIKTDVEQQLSLINQSP